MLARLEKPPDLCPHCGQHMPRFPELGDLHLTVAQARIYGRIRRAGKDGIPTASLVDALYGHRYDGGPENAMVAVRVFIWQLNKKLRAHGIRIRGWRGIGGYTVEQFDVD